MPYLLAAAASVIGFAASLWAVGAVQ